MKKVVALLVAVILSLGVSSYGGKVFASSSDENTYKESNQGAKYTYILYCRTDLTLQSLGRFLCSAETNVQMGYNAGVVVELQQSNGGTWTTIKSWSNDSAKHTSVNEYWYVVKGTYRVKSTHTAMNSSGTVLETTTQYSNTVIYN